MPAHDKCEVWLESGGVRLEEFCVAVDSSDDSGKTVACWVPCETGQDFVIAWSTSLVIPEDARLKARITIDGETVIKQHMYNHHKQHRFTGPRIDDNHRKSLYFSSIDLDASPSDDETVASSQKNNDPGNILVELLQFRESGSMRPHTHMKLPLATVPKQTTKHTVTHCVQLGETIEDGKFAKLLPKNEPYDKNNPGPIARFHFRYRPRELLQDYGIITQAALPAEDLKLYEAAYDFKSSQQSVMLVPRMKRLVTRLKAKSIGLSSSVRALESSYHKFQVFKNAVFKAQIQMIRCHKE